MKATVKKAVCDVCSKSLLGVGLVPCVDFGWYQRITGVTGQARYLCEKHARGLKAHQLLVPISEQEKARRLALGKAYANFRAGEATSADMALIEESEKSS